MQVSRFYKHPVPVLIFGAFIISFSSVFVKTSQVPALVSAFYRVFFGCLFLVGACWIKGEFRKKSLKKICWPSFGQANPLPYKGLPLCFLCWGWVFFPIPCQGCPLPGPD